MGYTRRPIAVVGSVVVVLALVVVAAAVGGNWELEARDWGAPGEVEPVEAEPPQLPPPITIDVPGAEPRDWGWLEVVVRVLLAIGALLGVWWAWQLLRDRLAEGSVSDGGAGAGAVATDNEPELPVLRRGVVEAQRHLDRIGRADDAVIAAWLALEEAAGDSGVRRGAAQTPTEFTLAVLARTSADPRATHDLLGLYHRARFSDQPVREGEVAAARACLGRLAESWDAVPHLAEPDA